MKFNPKLIEFLEKNKDITLLGIIWSLVWRVYFVSVVASIILTIISFLIK